MSYKVRIVSILSLAACFILSAILIGNPEITEKLMWALIAVCGVGLGVPAVAAGVKALRKSEGVDSRWQERPRQTVRGGLSASEVITAYQEAFNIAWWRTIVDLLLRLFGFGGVFQLADASYRELDDDGEQRLLGLLERDKTDLEEYKAEDFDCDDFTFRLMGEIHKDPVLCAMPIFITWVSWLTAGSWIGRLWQRFKRFVTGQRAGHAVISYYKTGVVSIVKIAEPQNDDIYPVPEGWRLDLLCG